MFEQPFNKTTVGLWRKRFQKKQPCDIPFLVDDFIETINCSTLTLTFFSTVLTLKGPSLGLPTIISRAWVLRKGATFGLFLKLLSSLDNSDYWFDFRHCETFSEIFRYRQKSPPWLFQFSASNLMIKNLKCLLFCVCLHCDTFLKFWVFSVQCDFSKKPGCFPSILSRNSVLRE